MDAPREADRDRGAEALAGLSTPLEPDVPLERFVESATEALPDAEGAIRAGKLAGRSMTGAIWILAAPVLLQQTMAACVGMADKLFAGQLPAGVRVHALDAIGIGSYVSWFIGIAMAGLGIGGQAIIARAMGAGERGLAQRALGQAVTTSVAWGAVVGVILWVVAAPVARMCQLSAEATVSYVEYIGAIACAMPAAGLMMVGAMCLHGAGETARPSAIAILVNVVNVVAAWALSGVDVRFGAGADAPVLVNPLSFDLHVRGIAIGTAISYAVGAAATMVVLGRGVRDLRLHARDLVPEWGTTWRVMRLGVPSFLEGLSMWTVNLIVLVFIGQIARSTAGGEGLQGAHIIAVQWEAFSFLPGFAIGTAAGALAGQYLGAGNPRMARRAIVACAIIAAAVMSVVGVVFMLVGRELTALVSLEPVHLAIAPRLLLICGTVQAFFAAAMVIRQGLRGAGDALWVFWITTFSSYAVRMPAAWLLGVSFGLGLEGIWYALCGEIVVRALLFLGRFVHGGWQGVRV